MKLFSVVFDDLYLRLALALQASVRANWRAAEMEVIRVARPRRISGHTRPTSNWTAKWMEWKRVADRQSEPFILLDADMLVLRPMEDAFENGWAGNPPDCIATERPGAICPISTGVLFVRPGDGSAALFEAVAGEVGRLLADREALRNANAVHGGIDQSAYAAVSRSAGPWRCGLLPQSRWNLTRWDEWEPGQTRAVHYWGELRRIVLRKRPLQSRDSPKLRELVHLWWEFDRSAGGDGRAAKKHARRSDGDTRRDSGGQ